MIPTSKRISLPSLIQHLPGAPAWQLPDVLINGIAYDSRSVNPGNLFVALTGGNVDGHQYIPDAVRRGAATVVGTKDLKGIGVPYFQVSDGRQALAILSAAFFGFPARQLTVIGVTGTDGKTTTCSLIFSILRSAGIPAGMISTVNALIGDRILDTGFHVTTPESPEVQDYLASMVQEGLTHVVLEATSHGLSQQRLSECAFDIGVVTNITHEHLDYHGDYESYRAAKAILFQELARKEGKQNGVPALAVLNRDDRSYEFLSGLVSELKPVVSQISYGMHPQADVRAEDIQREPGSLRFYAVGRDFRVPVETRLFGDYNVSNCLAAIATTWRGLNLPAGAITSGIAGMERVPGRMEQIDLGQDFLAYVDFAHTPNGLRRALQAAREISNGRVIAVFGSAGLRDRAKRRLMAQVSAELANLSILTAEDPRTESLDAILAEMASGAESRGGVEGQTFWRVPDRGEALRFAVSLARPGDIVIAFGKGHEQSMCFGEVEYPWDDRQALRAALSEHLNQPGPEMPYLPTQDS